MSTPPKLAGVTRLRGMSGKKPDRQHTGQPTDSSREEHHLKNTNFCQSEKNSLFYQAMFFNWI